MDECLWLVLDAMGVIYRSCDDVEEILIPYLRDRGCRLGDAEIGSLYLEASLGRRSSAEFWAACRVDGVDAEYISRHTLSVGLFELLGVARARGIGLVCLSNDVSEWSILLRENFGLTDYFDHWCISGDIGFRKPDAAAYQSVLDATGAAANDCLFIDDRNRNVEAAKLLGMNAWLFGSPECESLTELADLLS